MLIIAIHLLLWRWCWIIWQLSANHFASLLSAKLAPVTVLSEWKVQVLAIQTHPVTYSLGQGLLYKSSVAHVLTLIFFVTLELVLKGQSWKCIGGVIVHLLIVLIQANGSSLICGCKINIIHLVLESNLLKGHLTWLLL